MAGHGAELRRQASGFRVVLAKTGEYKQSKGKARLESEVSEVRRNIPQLSGIIRSWRAIPQFATLRTKCCKRRKLYYANSYAVHLCTVSCKSKFDETEADGPVR